MVAPLIAAAARGAAKGAAKKAAAKGAARKSASKAVSGAPRKRKAGDDSTNARKRFYRASERYLKKAEESSGTTSKRYRQLARQNFEDAIATYDPANTQKFSKPIQRLAAEFGYDLEEYRRYSSDYTEAIKQYRVREKRQKRVISESENVLEGKLNDPDTRRELEAETLFRSSEIGRRIIGGYSEVWRDEATVIDKVTGERRIDTRRIFKALYKYFGVDNLADLIEKVEAEVGDSLYEMGNDDEIYEVVKLTITNKVLENDLYE